MFADLTGGQHVIEAEAPRMVTNEGAGLFAQATTTAIPRER